MSEPRARLGQASHRGREQDPEWQLRVDTLTEAIFKRSGGPRRIAEAVAADVVTGLSDGRSLATIAARASGHTEIYAIAFDNLGELGSLPHPIKASLPRTEEAAAVARGVSDETDPDKALVDWTRSLMGDVEAFARRRLT